MRVEFGEGLPPFLRKPDDALPSVRFGGLSGDQSPLSESGQKAAEITGVKPQLRAHLGRRSLFTLSQLVNDPGLGQGKLSFQYMLAQHADLFRVKAIEAPHRFDARREIVLSHDRPPLKRGQSLVD